MVECVRLAKMRVDVEGGIMISVTIESAGNGYIVRHMNENIEGKPIEIVDVCEQAEVGCQCSAVAGALRLALEALGMYGSKHDACRAVVSCKCDKGEQ